MSRDIFTKDRREVGKDLEQDVRGIAMRLIREDCVVDDLGDKFKLREGDNVGYIHDAVRRVLNIVGSFGIADGDLNNKVSDSEISEDDLSDAERELFNFVKGLFYSESYSKTGISYDTFKSILFRNNASVLKRTIAFIRLMYGYFDINRYYEYHFHLNIIDDCIEIEFDKPFVAIEYEGRIKFMTSRKFVAVYDRTMPGRIIDDVNNPLLQKFLSNYGCYGIPYSTREDGIEFPRNSWSIIVGIRS